MTYTPHQEAIRVALRDGARFTRLDPVTHQTATVSCGCCSGGCACTMHSYSGRKQICDVHAHRPHPGTTSLPVF